MQDSPFLKMEFCCGCWLEGGDSFGDLYSAIEEFARRGKISIVHLRNVTSPLPQFSETFIDGGYGDVYRILKSLVWRPKFNLRSSLPSLPTSSSGCHQCLQVKCRYAGTVILDHTPEFVPEAGPAAASAYAIGYIKGCLLAATKESLDSEEGDQQGKRQRIG